jgi:hypothetical protein
MEERIRAYGVMGMELRIRDPRAEGVAPSRLGVAPSVGLLSPEPDWRAGVSRTSLRNCELFIALLRIGCEAQEIEVGDKLWPSFSLVKVFSAARNYSYSRLKFAPYENSHFSECDNPTTNDNN